MNEETLFVFPNLEMGDNIVCNGLCRVLALREKSIIWVARARYAQDIGRMFSDLSNVHVVDGYDYPEARRDLFPRAACSVCMGYFSPEPVDWRTVAWDEKFYSQAGVSFEERWSAFKLPESLLPEKVVPSGEVLVHEVEERGFLVDSALLPTGKISRITRAPSFWDWVSPICSASELHFVDSSYLNLAESLYALGFLRETKLVFHSYSKRGLHGSVPPILRSPWEIL